MSITGRDLFDAAEKKRSDETLDLKSVELLGKVLEYFVWHIICSRPKYQISTIFDFFLSLNRIVLFSELFPLPQQFFKLLNAG